MHDTIHKGSIVNHHIWAVVERFVWIVQVGLIYFVGRKKKKKAIIFVKVSEKPKKQARFN